MDIVFQLRNNEINFVNELKPTCQSQHKCSDGAVCVQKSSDSRNKCVSHCISPSAASFIVITAETSIVRGF